MLLLFYGYKSTAETVELICKGLVLKAGDEMQRKTKWSNGTKTTATRSLSAV